MDWLSARGRFVQFKISLLDFVISHSSVINLLLPSCQASMLLPFEKGQIRANFKLKTLPAVQLTGTRTRLAPNNPLLHVKAFCRSGVTLIRRFLSSSFVGGIPP
jgi:hypothetical protein